MPLKRSYTKQTAREALHWLKEQEEIWAKQIRDVDVAVQLYLNFKNRRRVKQEGFCRELKALCGEGGATPLKIQKKNEEGAASPFETAEQPPADLYNGALFSSPDLNPSLPTGRAGNPAEMPPFPDALSLNEKTREILSKTALRLNLDRETDALNILVQFGFASLKTLIKDL